MFHLPSLLCFLLVALCWAPAAGYVESMCGQVAAAGGVNASSPLILSGEPLAFVSVSAIPMRSIQIPSFRIILPAYDFFKSDPGQDLAVRVDVAGCLVATDLNASVTIDTQTTVDTVFFSGQTAAANTLCNVTITSSQLVGSNLFGVGLNDNSYSGFQLIITSLLAATRDSGNSSIDRTANVAVGLDFGSINAVVPNGNIFANVSLYGAKTASAGSGQNQLVTGISYALDSIAVSGTPAVDSSCCSGQELLLQLVFSFPVSQYLNFSMDVLVSGCLEPMWQSQIRLVDPQFIVLDLGNASRIVANRQCLIILSANGSGLPSPFQFPATSVHLVQVTFAVGAGGGFGQTLDSGFFSDSFNMWTPQTLFHVVNRTEASPSGGLYLGAVVDGVRWTGQLPNADVDGIPQTIAIFFDGFAVTGFDQGAVYEAPLQLSAGCLSSASPLNGTMQIQFSPPSAAAGGSGLGTLSLVWTGPALDFAVGGSCDALLDLSSLMSMGGSQSIAVVNSSYSNVLVAFATIGWNDSGAVNGSSSDAYVNGWNVAVFEEQIFTLVSAGTNVSSTEPSASLDELTIFATPLLDVAAAGNESSGGGMYATTTMFVFVPKSLGLITGVQLSFAVTGCTEVPTLYFEVLPNSDPVCLYYAMLPVAMPVYADTACVVSVAANSTADGTTFPSILANPQFEGAVVLPYFSIVDVFGNEVGAANVSDFAYVVRSTTPTSAAAESPSRVAEIHNGEQPLASCFSETSFASVSGSGSASGSGRRFLGPPNMSPQGNFLGGAAAPLGRVLSP